MRKQAYANRYAEYLEKRAEAERSGALEDAVAAGKAWRDFLKLFAPRKRQHHNQAETSEA